MSMCLKSHNLMIWNSEIENLKTKTKNIVAERDEATRYDKFLLCIKNHIPDQAQFLYILENSRTIKKNAGM